MRNDSKQTQGMGSSLVHSVFALSHTFVLGDAVFVENESRAE